MFFLRRNLKVKTIEYIVIRRTLIFETCFIKFLKLPLPLTGFLPSLTSPILETFWPWHNLLYIRIIRIVDSIEESRCDVYYRSLLRLSMSENPYFSDFFHLPWRPFQYFDPSVKSFFLIFTFRNFNVYLIEVWDFLRIRHVSTLRFLKFPFIINIQTFHIGLKSRRRVVSFLSLNLRVGRFSLPEPFVGPER